MKPVKYSQFKQLVINRLKTWGLYSPEVVELMCMIVAHESGGGVHRVQVGGGPALGLFQIERKTHDSIWANSDTIVARAKRFGFIQRQDALLDDVYSIFMARHYIAMDSSPVPKTEQEQSEYCKSYWNRTGAASPKKYLDDYRRWVAAG